MAPRRRLGPRRSAHAGTFFDLESTDIRGAPFSFKEYEGKVTLVTNVASK